MEDQLWVDNRGGTREDYIPIIDEKLVDVRPIRNRKKHGKPRWGLWTSTFKPHGFYCSNWVEWIVNYVPDWISIRAFVLTPLEDIDVFTIDSKKDWFELYEKYTGREQKLGPGIGGDYYNYNGYIDWEKASEYLDAVHLTNKGYMRWAEGLVKKYDDKVVGLKVSDWSVESTIWFRDVFDEIQHIRDVPHTCTLTDI